MTAWIDLSLRIDRGYAKEARSRYQMMCCCISRDSSCIPNYFSLETELRVVLWGDDWLVWDNTMAVWEKHSTKVTQFIHKLRGGSQPILVQASDGLLYVAKFADNPQGANLPFNESIGAELYRACGLSVPSWKPLLISDSFLDRNPGCWMETEHGPQRPAAGLCFGSRFLGGADARLLEILPETRYQRIRQRASFWLAWLVDVCAEHADNRQAVFLDHSVGLYDAYFVDLGHLFGGPRGNRRVHFIASRYLDSRIYPDLSSEQRLRIQSVLRALDVDKLWRRICALPDDWKMGSALESFERCLGRLSNPHTLQNVLDTIIESQIRRIRIENHFQGNQRKNAAAVLCSRIQTGAQPVRSVVREAGHLVCGKE
jgi:hypothetical protein